MHKLTINNVTQVKYAYSAYVCCNWQTATEQWLELKQVEWLMQWERWDSRLLL